MTNLLILVHTFPPRGSVGGSIRLIKFLKYINELRSDIKSVIITIKDDFILLNDPHLSKMSLNEISDRNPEIIKTNTFQPRHPNQNLSNETRDSSISEKNLKFSVKELLKRLYYSFEKYFLIPDYGVLWFPFSILRALKEIEKQKIDIIYATAPPFSVLVQAAIIKKITKKKLLIDIKDDWIYQPTFIAKPFYIKYIERKMEAFCVKNADKIILVTRSSLEDFSKRYPELENKFFLIPNGCDVSEYEKNWNINYSKNQRFTIIHSGVLSSSRDPSGFLSALQNLKQNNIINCDNFEMRFIGLMPKEFFKMVDEKKLNDIISVSDYLGREEYIQTICKADLLLAFNYQIKTLIPGKLYDYWGSRRPVLLIDFVDSMAAKLVFENKLGTVKDFKDVEGITAVIKDYFTSWCGNSAENKTEIENLMKYDRKNLTKKLLEIIDSMQC